MLHIFERTINCCRFFQRLTGDARAISEEGGPTAEQLCFEAIASQAPLLALDWTQRGDGLLCADLAGSVTMYKLRLPLRMQPLNRALSGDYQPSNFEELSKA